MLMSTWIIEERSVPAWIKPAWGPGGLSWLREAYVSGDPQSGSDPRHPGSARAVAHPQQESPGQAETAQLYRTYCSRAHQERDGRTASYRDGNQRREALG